MDLGQPPGMRPQDYWSPRLSEVLGWMPDDLEDLTLNQLHTGYIYAHAEE